MPAASLSAPGYAYAELGPQHHCASAELASECALALSYNELNHTVMMVSPDDLDDFAIGFSLSAGLVDSIDDIYDIQLCGTDSAREAQLRISSRTFWRLRQQRRQLTGNSSCGLCGVEALEQALPQLKALTPSALPPASHLHALRERIAAAQQGARNSGALHAALFVDARGEIVLCREDIGRHNALDKLIGALARSGQEANTGFVVVTSRCSLELLHKAVRCGIATLVSLSAPTALTVDWARRHHLNLIHLPHHSAPRVYSPAPEESRA